MYKEIAKNIESNILAKLKKFGTIRLNEQMRKHTTFKTGGPADILIYPNNNECLKEIVIIAQESLIPVEVIGGGSNLLVGDKGIRGIVVKLSEDNVVKGKIDIIEDCLVYVDSIKKKEDFIKFCLYQGFEGMEFMAGIPGCMGGGIVMNAGTSLGSFVDILYKIIYLNGNCVIKTKEVEKGMAGYRSINLERNFIILGGIFKLKRSENIPMIKKRVEDIINDRALKHPLDFPSAGSIFKNPPGQSSWKLINDVGLKGERIGGALVSDIHTNFIINVNNATSNDILCLIDRIKERVFSKFNILLEAEIRVIGEFS